MYIKMMKKMSPMFAIACTVMLLFSCNDESVSDEGNLKLKAAASLSNSLSQKFTGLKEQSSVEITTFMINIKEIELEIDDDDDMMENLYTDIELEGPFELDLLSGSTTIDIASATLPNNIYEEIEFDMDVCTNQDSELFEKSILIKGTINNVPFVFWHDTNEEFEIDYPNVNDNLIIDGGTVVTVINFELSLIFGAGSMIDFSLAIDRDGDGVIEINPNNDDDNKEIADLIKDLLEESSDLLDD